MFTILVPFLVHPLQTMANINALLERADKVYRHLVQLRNDLDQLLISLASGHSITVSSGRAVSGHTGGSSLVPTFEETVGHVV